MGCGNVSESHLYEKGIFSIFPMIQYSIPIQNEINTLQKVGQYILLGGKDDLEMLDIKTKDIKSLSKEHKGFINSIILLQNEKFATAGQDNTIKIWDLSKQEPLMTLKGHTSMIWTLCQLKDGTILSGADDKKLKRWDLNQENKEIFSKDFPSAINKIIQLKNGKILIGDIDGIVLLDPEKFEKIGEIKFETGVWSLLQLFDGKVACGLGDGTLAILDCFNSKEINVKKLYKGSHKKTITNIIELENGNVITSSDEQNIILWSFQEKSNTKCILEGHSDKVSSLCNIGENRFVSVSKDKTLALWN